jgi:dienelactone hydrolase
MQFNSRKTIIFITLVIAFSIYSQLELPAPTGPYAVGRTILRWVDTSRPEVLTGDPKDSREVVAVMWYPAEAGTGRKTVYFPNLSSVSDALMQSGEVEKWQVFGLGLIRSVIRLEANPVKAERPFPVLILSPGNGTNIEFYASLAGEVASQGYIVVGLNHPYDVPAVELSHGKVAAYDKDQWLLDAKAHQAYITERIRVRTEDILFTLEHLDNVNSTGRFAGMMDLNAVAVGGHSLGGITASEACKADPRFKACLNLDGLQRGGPFSMEETAIPPKQPFLFLTKESELHAKLLERFESMSTSYWVTVHGASHQSFTDGPLLQPTLVLVPNQADQLMTLIQKFTLAFLDQTLKGRPNGLLSKTVAKENVSIRVFPSN